MFAQLPYEEMRAKLLKNQWADADYELYMSEYNLKNNKENKFTVPAYFIALKPETENLIANAIVFYKTANSIYVHGEKRFIDESDRMLKMTEKNGQWFLAAKLLYKILDVKLSASQHPTELVSIVKVAKALGKAVTETKTGLVFVSQSKNSQLDAISEAVQYELLYTLLFERPDAKTILADVQNQTGGKHPYILANSNRFEEIKQLIKTDTFAKQCYDKIIRLANKKVNEPGEYTYEYDNPLGGSFASLKVKISIFDLIMAYSLTGEKKYADRAWQDMDAVSKWPDWGNSKGRQFLRTGSICLQMALGYDWLYNYLTPEQRKQIKEALVEKAIRPGLFYNMCRDSRFVTSKNNWNPVSNQGLASAALAVAFDEPELSGRMLWFSIGSLENVLSIYASDGAYEEGPLYWAFGTGSLVKALSAIETATGHTYGLSEAPGMEKTAYFTPHMIGPGGYFNFHDAAENSETVLTNPEFFWFANRYANPDFYWMRKGKPEQQKGGAYDLLWYRGKVNGAFNLPLDYLGRGLNNSVGTGSFRSSWTDPNALYLGFHAGYRMANHAQADEGNFIFDAMGERWLIDVGYGSRDTIRSESYFQSARPFFYRMRTEGHNCYVINPDQSYGQDFSTDNRPQFETVSTHPDKAFAIANIACSYKGQVTSARRGFLLNRQQNYAYIQDEVTLTKPSTVYWFLHTRAKIELIEKDQAAIFTIGTKRLYVKLVGNVVDANWSVMPAKSLMPGMIEMKNMDDVRKLSIKFDSITNMNFGVVLMPLKEGENKPTIPIFQALDRWQ